MNTRTGIWLIRWVFFVGLYLQLLYLTNLVDEKRTLEIIERENKTKKNTADATAQEPFVVVQNDKAVMRELQQG